MMLSPPLESTTHLVSHLLREIDGALCDVLEPSVEQWRTLASPGVPKKLLLRFLQKLKFPLSKDESSNHKTKIRMNLGYLHISESDPVAKAWLRLAKKGDDYSLSRLAHRRGLSEPRPLDQGFKEFWQEIQRVHRIVLDKFEAHYTSVFDTLDRILANNKPSRADLKQLRTHVPDNIVTWNYFFGKLPGPGWLTPLKESGAFDNPPNPQFDHETKMTRLVPWPQSRYLARIASTNPTEALRIILGLPNTENTLVHSDLADAALAMPPELAAEWGKKETNWIKTQENIDFLLPQKLGELIGHLARGKQPDIALDLTRSLLSTIAPKANKTNVPLSEPQARFDIWHYEQILQTRVPELVTAAGERALALFCELLESAVQKYLNRTGPEDYSNLWRAAIEDNKQYHLSDPKDYLVSAVRDASLQLVRTDESRLPMIVSELEKHQWLIFRRIALYVLWRFPSGNGALIAYQLTDLAGFDNLTLWHEYSLLARDHFVYLSSENKIKILDWISNGPDRNKISARRGSKDKSPSKEEIELYAKNWQLRHLARIHRSLPEEWKSRYNELKQELGEPEHPEFLSYTTGGFVGPTSPKKAEELQSMSVTDIVSYVKSWHPSGGLLESSPEGFGRVLSAVVSSEPNRFANDALLFRGADPTYVRALLGGFSEAVNQKHSYQWNTILELCQWVMEQPRDITSQQESFEFDVGWGQARKTIASLFSAGFHSGPCEIPFDLRKDAWKVLEPITEDPDPTPELEKANYDQSNMSPSELSINSVRGEAIEAVIYYASWVRRHVKRESNNKQPVSDGLDEMPEVRLVLDAHLDLNRDPSLAIRSIYGRYFTWLAYLDRNWILKQISRIFPSSDSLRDFRDVAWESYVVFCRPSADAFPMLRASYHQGVEHIDDQSASKWRNSVANPKERLADHLMELYWHDELQLTDTMLENFYAKASDVILEHAMTFIGQSLMSFDKKDLTSTLIERLKRLWLSRLEAAQSPNSDSTHKLEVSAFGWWFASEKFEDEWALAQLLSVLKIADEIKAEHEVVKRLSDLASNFPDIVIDCLSLMIKKDKRSLFVLAWHEQVRQILNTAINSDNQKACDEASELINRLSAAGHLQFRELLRKKNDLD
jgi:hypothetical protein